MIFQPVVHPIVLAVLAVAAVGLVGWGLVRSRGVGNRVLWCGRAALVLLCFAALLRPGIPGGATPTLTSHTDIFLVVDTTSSIVAEDWNGDRPRLEGVRDDVEEIIATYPGARFALITFDATAQLRLPLTTDTSAVVSSMEVMRPEVTAHSRGSSIGVAAPMLASTLESAATRHDDRARMVFYFGDGEQTVSASPESFESSKKVTDGGAVFGYGTAAGGPMKLTTGRAGDEPPGYITFEGRDALSTIDEKALQGIASELGVTYQHRTAEAEAKLPPTPSTSEGYTEAGGTASVIELFWIPVLGIIVLLGFEVCRATIGIVRMRSLVAARPHDGGAA